MKPEPAPTGQTESTDNRPTTVKVRGSIELGTMRWVLILGMVAAVLALLGAAAGRY